MKTITYEEASHHLDYNPETGEFIWKIPAQGRKKLAGASMPRGYRVIGINGVVLFAHRLAWLLTYREMPAAGYDVDHIDGNQSNNRISNLRLATRSQNLRNAKLSCRSTTGVKGVAWHKNRNGFVGHIRHNNKANHIGIFSTIQEAEAAVKAAREKLHGEFCRHA